MYDIQVPQRCSECGKLTVRPDVIPYTARVKHDGTLYALSIANLHVYKCQSCGEVLFNDGTDDQISQGLRERLGLLSPQQIRERLGVLGLMQKDFAERIRVAPETVSRWLSGAHIQSRAMDMLMRMFFERESSPVKPRLPASDVDCCEVPSVALVSKNERTGKVTLVTGVGVEVRSTTQWSDQCRELGILPAERAPIAAEIDPAATAAESNLAMAA
jgi:DNA-binding transcriptional regulator YiaG